MRAALHRAALIDRKVIEVAERRFDSLLFLYTETGGFDTLLNPRHWQAERACQLLHGNALFVVGVQTKGQVLVVEQTPKIISGHTGEVAGLSAVSPYKIKGLTPECSESGGTTGGFVHVFAMVRHGDMIEVDGEPLQLIGNFVAAHRQAMTGRNGPWTKFSELLHGSASRIPIRRIVGRRTMQFRFLLGDSHK